MLGRVAKALGIAAVLLVGTSAQTLAVAPSVDAFAIDSTFIPPLLSAACGFPVSRHVVGTLTVRTYFGGDGSFAREVDAYKLTETLTANGKSIIGRTTQQIFVSVLS